MSGGRGTGGGGRGSISRIYAVHRAFLSFQNRHPPAQHTVINFGNVYTTQDNTAQHRRAIMGNRRKKYYEVKKMLTERKDKMFKIEIFIVRMG